METRIRKDDRLRIVGDFKGNNFIDIRQVGYESIAVDLHASFNYIEIRRKEQQIRVFTFPKKSLKKECDFGWWEDAEVVYSVNEQIMCK